MKLLRFFKVFLLLSVTSVLSSTAQVPVVDWTTYYGGQLTSANSVVYSSVEDCIYISGYTADTNGIASLGSYMSSIPSYVLDPIYLTPTLISNRPSFLFVAKFDMSGNRLWATYWGGDSSDYLPRQMEVDFSGNVLISGTTKNLSGLATPGAFLESSSNDSIANYILKVSKTGTPLWCTYIDYLPDSIVNTRSELSVQVDSSNNIYLVGSTNIDGLATSGSYQPYRAGGNDIFIMKMDSTGNRLWSTYYGGVENEQIFGTVDIAPSGFLYFTMRRIDESNNYIDVLVKFNPDLEDEVWNVPFSEYSNSNRITTMDVQADKYGNVYILGSYSKDITLPAWNKISPDAFRTEEDLSSDDYGDLFLLKYNKDGVYQWGTLFGGDGYEGGQGLLGLYETWFSKMLKISSSGEFIYFGTQVMGTTDMPGNSCGIDYTYKGGALAKFDSNGVYQWGGFFDAPISGLDIKNESRVGKDGFETLFIVSKTSEDGLATPGSFKDNKDGLIFTSMLTKIIEYCPDDSISLNYTSPYLHTDSGYVDYTWYHNGISVGSTESASYHLGEDTTGYWFCIAESCGCQYISDTFYFSGSGMAEFEDMESWTLYPNPVTDELILDFGTEISIVEDSELRIVDVFGRRLYQKHIEKGQYKNIVISIKELPQGMYILSLGLSRIQFIKQ